MAVIGTSRSPACPDPAENERLLKRARAGDMVARDNVVKNNLGLVGSITKRFLNRGYDADDLFQIGVIGLIKSVDNFDPSFGVQFSTYAVPMIMGEIRRFLRDDGMLRVSRSLKEVNAKARRAREELTQASGRPPTIAELAAAVGIDTGELIIAMESAGDVASLYQPDAGGDRYLIDRLNIDEGSGERLTDAIALRQIIEKLPAREKRIIYMRFYQDKTQTQVAEEVGVSQVQVSRIERKILRFMRQQL